MKLPWGKSNLQLRLIWNHTHTSGMLETKLNSDYLVLVEWLTTFTFYRKHVCLYFSLWLYYFHNQEEFLNKILYFHFEGKKGRHGSKPSNLSTSGGQNSVSLVLVAKIRRTERMPLGAEEGVRGGDTGLSCQGHRGQWGLWTAFLWQQLAVSSTTLMVPAEWVYWLEMGIKNQLFWQPFQYTISVSVFS